MLRRSEVKMTGKKKWFEQVNEGKGGWWKKREFLMAQGEGTTKEKVKNFRKRRRRKRM